MADKILYTNKEELIDDESIPLKNKVTADDMNEIKGTVNSHADDIGTLDNQKADRTEIPTDLSELSNENTKFVNETQLGNEATARQNADNDLQGQINNRYTKTEIDNKFNVTNGNIATLQVDSAHRIELSINQTNYVMTATLKNKAGTVLNQSSIDLPLESVVVNGRYDSATKKIILTLQNGNTIEIPVGDLISGLQSEITPQNKLSSDLVDDTNHTNKFVTQAEKNQIETNKNNITSLDENKENISNKVTELTEESTDTQYPSAKAVYDNESALKEKLDRYKNTIETELGDSTNTGTDLTLNGTAEFDVGLELSGNTYQATTEGYQLFDKDNATVKSMNASATAGNTGTYAPATNQKHVFIQCKPNTTYTVQKDISDVAVLGIYETEQEPAVGVAYKTLYFLSSSPETITVTTGENVNYLDLRLNSNAITNEVLQKILDSILIYEGSDTKPYEKYTGKNPAPNPSYPQTVQVVKGNNEVKIENKNIISGNTSNTSRGITTTLNNNILTITGTTLSNWWNGVEVQKHIPISNLSASIQKALPFTLNIILTLENGTTKTLSISKGNTSASSNITSPAVKYNINFASAEIGATYNETVELQLELNSTVTNYVPHKEQTYPITLPEGMEMCKIGDYADEFLWQNNIWNKNKKINKLVFNGTESWSYNATNNYFSLTNIGPVRNLTQSALSNKYIFDDRNSGYTTLINNRFAFQVYNNRLNIFIKDGRFTNVEDFKNDLANINLVVYYVLETQTPVLEEITDTTLIPQLNNIKQAYTYQGQTNISQTNADLPFIIKADFKLSNLSRIQALENALETVSSRVDLLEE